MKGMDLVSIGVVVILLGFVLVFLGSVLGSTNSSEKGQSKVAVVGLFGPIPFGFGNDKNLFVTTLVIALVFFVLMLFFSKRLF